MPSLESGEKSKIKWHYARNHDKKQVLWLSHTPTGKSAFENKTYFPTKNNGKKINAYISTYRRMKWDEPAPAITIRNDAISSQRNVHPGKRLKNGKFQMVFLNQLQLLMGQGSQSQDQKINGKENHIIQAKRKDIQYKAKLQ